MRARPNANPITPENVLSIKTPLPQRRIPKPAVAGSHRVARNRGNKAPISLSLSMPREERNLRHDNLRAAVLYRHRLRCSGIAGPVPWAVEIGRTTVGVADESVIYRLRQRHRLLPQLR